MYAVHGIGSYDARKAVQSTQKAYLEMTQQPGAILSVTNDGQTHAVFLPSCEECALMFERYEIC